MSWNAIKLTSPTNRWTIPPTLEYERVRMVSATFDYKMKKPTGKQIATFLVGPWMIIPTAFVFALLSLFVYGDPPEIHGDLERALFLQGNTDMGGGCLFAATVGLYVTFGFTAAWYLVLKMQESTTPVSFRKNMLKSLWFLKFHILAFLIGGTADLAYDARVTPNDFKNMFLLAGLTYILCILLVTGLHPLRMPLLVRLAVAPLFTVLWLIIGSDGNTARAGQLVQSGQDPEWRPRSTRHHIMLKWHQGCDTVFEITENGESNQ